MKKVFLLSVIALFVFAFSSCEECKDCKIVTYATDGTTVEKEESKGEYCGEDLDDVDGQEDTDPSGIKSEWVCE